MIDQAVHLCLNRLFSLQTLVLSSVKLSHPNKINDSCLNSSKQEASKASPSHDSHSPEVTSRAGMAENDVNEVVRGLAEKLSAALVNVSAKEDLVKQHAKVAEEAVAGTNKCLYSFSCNYLHYLHFPCIWAL